MSLPPSPGTVCVVANSTDWRQVVPDGCQVILDLSSLKVAVPPSSRLLALYGTTATNTLAAAIAAAVPLHTRVFDVYDADGHYPQDRLVQLRRWDLPALELYWRLTESLPHAVDRWDDNLRDLLGRWPGQIGTALQDYTMLGQRSLAEVVAIQPAMITAVNAHGPRVALAITFAWNRADGGQLPPLASVQQQVAAQSPGLPGLIPIPSPTRLPQAFILTGAHRMKVYAKLNGKYIGVDPAHPTVVYHDRTTANGWEAITLEKLPNSKFAAKFDAAGVYLSITDLGNLETRPSVGAWESLCGITPPVEYKDTPSQLYQPDHGAVLQLEIQP